MTCRTCLPPIPNPPPDFTVLTSVEAHRRVRQLAAGGWADSNIAAVMGWRVADVRRALAGDGVELTQ
ncbi:MAG: hypothetical protein R3E75_08225 [Steroidobacteraceae bacterium]|nr:hypothetical protein [Nevskiaceae bacterium]MCP5472281.1 hypothetical protein [Nevskiaceae bacterium]